MIHHVMLSANLHEMKLVPTHHVFAASDGHSCPQLCTPLTLLSAKNSCPKRQQEDPSLERGSPQLTQVPQPKQQHPTHTAKNCVT